MLTCWSWCGTFSCLPPCAALQGWSCYPYAEEKVGACVLCVICSVDSTSTSQDYFLTLWTNRRHSLPQPSTAPNV